MIQFAYAAQVSFEKHIFQEANVLIRMLVFGIDVLEALVSNVYFPLENIMNHGHQKILQKSAYARYTIKANEF